MWDEGSSLVPAFRTEAESGFLAIQPIVWGLGELGMPFGTRIRGGISCWDVIA